MGWLRVRVRVRVRLRARVRVRASLRRGIGAEAPRGPERRAREEGGGRVLQAHAWREMQRDAGRYSEISGGIGRYREV